LENSLPLNNAEVAERLEEIAELLQSQGANVFRVRAYLGAAETIRNLETPIHVLLDAQGVEGLMRLPGIGQSLSRAIEQLVHTGRLGLLERLRGANVPERLFETVFGIGPELASRIHHDLGIETLAELEAAAYDGRLAQLPGIGRKRIRGIRESLAGRFRRRPDVPESRQLAAARNVPSVEELLDVDAEYRRKVERGRLPRIAPTRFNPTGEAWLPILHTVHADRHYTALYSNTARAHELGTTRDWVVIYRDDRHGDGQWTAITSHLGKLKGKRIIRGREQECLEYYAQLPTQSSNFAEIVDDDRTDALAATDADPDPRRQRRETSPNSGDARGR
jgi:putative hydrolase